MDIIEPSKAIVPNAPTGACEAFWSALLVDPSVFSGEVVPLAPAPFTGVVLPELDEPPFELGGTLHRSVEQQVTDSINPVPAPSVFVLPMVILEASQRRDVVAVQLTPFR